ncbi:MAG: TolC family protein [Chitinispirillaceae bacterium]|nr:TolC family protein [Chitinispirillaceae bacterium]
MKDMKNRTKTIHRALLAILIIYAVSCAQPGQSNQFVIDTINTLKQDTISTGNTSIPDSVSSDSTLFSDSQPILNSEIPTFDSLMFFINVSDAYPQPERTAKNDIASESVDSVFMTLQEAVDKFLISNPDVIRAKLEWMAGKDKERSSYGLYEPSLVISSKQETINRPLSRRAQSENTYKGGIEGILPSATKYDINFSLTDIQNRFYDNSLKPNTFSGISITQPLLQGLWFGKPIIDQKISRIEKKFSFQKYRATLSNKLLELEKTYWKVCFSQEKLNFALASIKMAQEIVYDSKYLVKAGKISSLEEIEAQAGLATRLANANDVCKELFAAINELQLLVHNGEKGYIHIVASTPLEILQSDSTENSSEAMQSSLYELQPEYLMKKAELEKSRVSKDLQADRCLPELNIKGTFGYLVDGKQTNMAWENFCDPVYRTRSGIFSLEAEFKIPLGIGYKEKNLLSVEYRKVRSSEIDLNETGMQLNEYLTLSYKRLSQIRYNLDNAKIIIEYRTTLLKAELVKQSAGKSNYRKIFEIEEELTKSKQWEMENIIEYKNTNAEISRLAGKTLLSMKLETIKDGKIVLNQKLTNAPKRVTRFNNDLTKKSQYPSDN